MDYRRLGRSDITVSTVCLGTMTWGEQNTEAEAFEQLDYAVDQGINFAVGEESHQRQVAQLVADHLQFFRIDPERGWLAVGHLVSPGDKIMFCRRDHDAAVADMKRMLVDVKRRAERPPRAGVYYSCVARGPHLFGSDSEELKMIRDELGDLPLVGFFANGEISHDRLYGYTGVLALFL